jgi:predicted nucleic acid-binding protein
MSRIFWDTNLFIYLFEGAGERHERVVELRKAMLSRGDQLVTSTLTLGEVLVKPAASGNESLVRQYESAILNSALTIPFDVNAARIFARIRADRSVRAPDAMQLACASAIGTDLFITNDDRLRSKHIDGIQFITGIENAPI